ncbi:hypothetical protein ACFOVU_13300 [Nocardiopsis sediminis]|uniref:Serine/threonine protein kinase n=1 Tax=Nocardiopsis sediminis TaxID=1778267 RepID=A0ABV8FQJ1_9ACTN
MPLEDADPRQLGAFRLGDRVSTTPEGVVYSARDSRGRPVSVAMLSAGAAADPAARDRFIAAVHKGVGVSGSPKVLASNTSGSTASWVAVSGGGDRAGAFLAPVGVGAAAATGGPSYAPYWATGSQPPATARWSWAGRGGGAAGSTETGPTWRVVVALLLVLALFIAILMMLFMWLSGLNQQASPPPVPPPSPSPSPSPSPESASPSPSPSDGSSPTNDPSSSPSIEPSSDIPTIELDEDEYTDFPAEPSNQA